MAYSKAIDLKEDFFRLIYVMLVQLLMQTPEVQKSRLQRLSSGVDLLIDDERLTPMGKKLLQELLA
jgi:hypothetical protein